MNPQKKMVYMQRIFNPTHHRSNGLNNLSKENFSRVMIESINKAINSNESAVKEKHVRKLLIGTFQAESGSFFWQYLPIIRLKENQIVCWKFCHVLHKLLRDGHKQVLTNSFERRRVLLDCGNMWRHVEDGYGQLIFKYCTLLYNRINFLERNPRFPNDLRVSDEQLDEIGERDVSVFFDLSCELFDSLDDILNLQEAVLTTSDMKKHNSMTSGGQCHLAPLVACIQDSSLLYDYSVKILFKLHSSLPPSTLEGHRERFLNQHEALQVFYLNTSNLQYFKTLIQIPHLTSRPPNFLIASDLKQHVTPQVIMIAGPERDSPDQISTQNDGTTSNLLVDFTEDSRSSELESNVSSSLISASTRSDDSIDTIFNQSNTNHDQSSFVEDSALSKINEELTNKIQEMSVTILELRNELELERTSHVSTRECLTREISQMRSNFEDQVKARDNEVKKVKDDLTNMKYELKASRGEYDKIRVDCERAMHDNEISQGAMKKLVKDLSDLKTENLTLRNRATVQVDNKVTKSLEELRKKISELNLELNKRDDQYKELSKEKEALASTKQKLEQQLDSQQEDLLVAEMDETDKIIKEASRRIEELSEKSRKYESGIKLQVNEKIYEVCSNLMKAVRNLIIQSRLLQREIVGNEPAMENAEFYKRNSSWTEGLISAANVVAMAARSLVDSADRTMSGAAKYSELAAAAHEIATATTQLVVASRVKANKESEKLKILTNAAKQVNQCTSNVVDTARVCGELIEQEVDKVDISSLSLHQTKKLEMETQVRLLELEDELSKQRIKLGLIRRQHYEQEDAQAASQNDKP